MSVLWALTLSVAFADKPARIRPADCEPLDESAFRTLVLDAQAALDRDDAALNTQILTEIDHRLPCLTFAPTPRVWADLLVSKAIAAFAAQGDWQTPLAAAIRVRPQIDRGVGPAHPIGKWEPALDAPAPVSQGPLPAGVELWVDGVRATELPPKEGLHLVQRESAGQWVSLVLTDAPVPAEWLTGVIVHPLQFEIDGHVGGGYEIVAVSQDLSDGWVSDYVPEGNLARGAPSVSMHGMTRVRQATLFVEGAGRFPSFQPIELVHADFAVGARLRRTLYAGLGAGMYRYPAYVGSRCMGDTCPPPDDPAALPGDGDVDLVWVRLAQVTGTVVWFGRREDSKVRAGATFSYRGLTGMTSFWWTKTLEGNWYIGLNSTLVAGTFGQEGRDLEDRRLTAGGGTLGVELGTRFSLDLAAR